MTEQIIRRQHDWPTLVSEWQKSGLTKAAYCKRNGLPASRFYAVIKSRNQPAAKSFAKAEFSPPTKSSLTSCVIELPNKTVIRLSNPSSDLLRALIK